MHFALWISRLSRGLEIPFWTFFNCPFHVEFENIHVERAVENVQDGISRPKVDREIQETKAGTVLPDTLY